MARAPESTITDKVRTLSAEQQQRYAETLKRLIDASREWYGMLSDLDLGLLRPTVPAVNAGPWPEEC